MKLALCSYPPKKSWGKAGNFSILAAFSLGLVLSFMALMLDLGQIYWVKNRNQNAAEAAASAAVRKLDQSPNGLKAACYEAAAMVNANATVDDEFAFVANCETPLASTNEIKFGTWDDNIGTFTKSTEPLAINAIQVNVSRLESKRNAVLPILIGVMRVFGVDVPESIDVASSAVAIYPNKPANESNIFPVAASSCGFLNSASHLACGREVIIGDNPGGIDAAANCPNNPGDCMIDSTGARFRWTSGTDQNLKPNTFLTMTNSLVDCLLGGSCALVHFGVGSTIYLQQGNFAGIFNDVLAQMPAFLADHTTIDVQIPIFAAAGSCSTSWGPSTNNVAIIGFGTLRINAIASTGSNQYVRGTIMCDEMIKQPSDINAIDFGTYGKSNSVLVQ
jgi:Flp pilus assembly protein TadG